MYMHVYHRIGVCSDGLELQSVEEKCSHLYGSYNPLRFEIPQRDPVMTARMWDNFIGIPEMV